MWKNKVVETLVNNIRTPPTADMDNDVEFVQQLLEGNPQYRHALEQVNDTPSSPPGLQRRLQRMQRSRTQANAYKTPPKSIASCSNSQPAPQQQNDPHRCAQRQVVDAARAPYPHRQGNAWPCQRPMHAVRLYCFRR